jgi:hypothetical protein
VNFPYFFHICIELVAPLSLISAYGNVTGVYNTSVGGDSLVPTSGYGVGHYPVGETPANACDNNTATKYLAYGMCERYETSYLCGLYTGFYVQPQGGASLVKELQICTASDSPERDPLTVTLEGSNESGIALTVGTSWTLIYNGSSGVDSDPGRSTCGATQFIYNTIRYKSYRFLVTSKRSTVDCVQYSEVQLFGY